MSTSVYNVYFSPYGITAAQAGTIDSFSVRSISNSWYSAAQISLTRGSPQVSATKVQSLQSVIRSSLDTKARELRYVENSLNRAYGRNQTALRAAILSGRPSHNNIGLTFNGKTYLRLYNEYLTLTSAVGLTAGILRSWSKSMLR